MNKEKVDAPVGDIFYTSVIPFNVIRYLAFCKNVSDDWEMMLVVNLHLIMTSKKNFRNKRAKS